MFKYFFLKKQQSLFEKSFLYQDFKTFGLKNHINQALKVDFPKKTKIIHKVNFQTKLFHTFKNFLISSMSTSKKVFTPHSSFNTFYIEQRRGGLSFLNVSKFFNR
jgi:hypothetical protein